jgi:hypothetical protein
LLDIVSRLDRELGLGLGLGREVESMVGGMSWRPRVTKGSRCALEEAMEVMGLGREHVVRIRALLLRALEGVYLGLLVSTRGWKMNKSISKICDAVIEDVQVIVSSMSRE